jgi:hypothetical protein
MKLFRIGSAVLAAGAISAVAAASAAAQTPSNTPPVPITPTVAASSAPGTLLGYLYGMARAFGQPVRAGDPIPAGATQLSYTYTAPSATANGWFTATCPTGTVFAAWEYETNPTAYLGPLDVPGLVLSAASSFPTQLEPIQAGPVQGSLVCMATATASAPKTYAKRVKAPVALVHQYDYIPSIKQGRRIPAGSVLISEKLTGLQPGVAAQVPIDGCPAGLVPVLTALAGHAAHTSWPNSGSSTDSAALIYAGAGIRAGETPTLYALCQQPSTPQNT